MQIRLEQTIFYITLAKERILPAIPPKNEELEKSEAVRQGKTKTVHEEPKIIRVKMREYVRILIILHYYYRCHVAEPIEIRISRVRPHADETEANLDRTADGVRTRHRSSLTAECGKINDCGDVST